MSSVAENAETVEASSPGGAGQAVKSSKKQNSGAWLLTAVCAVVGILIIASAWNDDGIDLDDPRQVLLEQTAVIEPDKAWLPGDNIAGIRAGQSMDEAMRLFRSEYWGSPWESGKIAIRGDVSSQRYVEQLWDVDDGRESESIAYVDLSSPASGNVVLSTMQHHEYKGLSGYPDVSELEAELVERFGQPTSRDEWSATDAFTLVWIRGEGSCTGCKYSSYSAPTRGDARKMAELGYPLHPVIVAEIERRASNPEKVGKFTLRMTDYGMIAKSAEAEAAAMEKAQAEFDKLSGPELKF